MSEVGLCDLSPDRWNLASEHTNHVEALNKLSVADKTKISLKCQLKHIYNEDRKKGISAHC